ncbi:hypothetical protein QUC31_002201 [Theobroma cacao]|uniref:Uncharacterized protein LOC18594131 n=2 Tax=Theobroma cacao TaxID=3641 RepID=A0AB32UY28_THECC|nr:PREDICTED: uncharacterized protein LOC18594131 [Theobroma cacao]EOY13183.1 Uncharacterized protein TCM_031710 [Theobroma cacao]
MAGFKVLFCLFLHALFFISSSGTRLFHPFSITGQALKEEANSQNKVSTDKLEIIDRHFESKQFSGLGKWTLAVEVKEHPETSSDRQEVSDRNHAPKQNLSSSKRAMIEEAREAIKASVQRNGGNPFESKRLSPGGPDPHHH